MIYNKTLLIDRKAVPSICVRTQRQETSTVHSDSHYNDYNITDSVVLNAEFANILHRRLNPAEYNDAVLSGQTETIDLLSSDEDDCKNDVANILTLVFVRIGFLLVIYNFEADLGNAGC